MFESNFRKVKITFVLFKTLSCLLESDIEIVKVIFVIFKITLKYTFKFDTFKYKFYIIKLCFEISLVVILKNDKSDINYFIITS